MKFVNLTPHVVTLRVNVAAHTGAPADRDFYDVVFPVSGKVARLETSVESTETVIHQDHALAYPYEKVQIINTRLSSVKDLPALDELDHRFDGDSPSMQNFCMKCGVCEAEMSSTKKCNGEEIMFIVSMPVAQACPERRDLVAPDTGSTCVRENGQIVAVTRFARYKRGGIHV